MAALAFRWAGPEDTRQLATRDRQRPTTILIRRTFNETIVNNLTVVPADGSPFDSAPGQPLYYRVSPELGTNESAGWGFGTAALESVREREVRVIYRSCAP